MKAKAQIEAGVCGFTTTAEADTDDGQNVAFHIESGCEKIRGMAGRLAETGPFDAYQEISPQSQSVLLATARGSLTGCCAGCVVPASLFKCMQVAAGLALPKDISVKIAAKE